MIAGKNGLGGRRRSSEDKALASGGSEPAWVVDREQRVFGLQVVLLKRVYVLPWTQFLYAEGTSDEVRAVFSVHDVVVRGSGLEALLADLAAQTVTLLREPMRGEKFVPTSGSRVLTVQVRRVEGSGPQV
jgi:hypothetical protein